MAAGARWLLLVLIFVGCAPLRTPPVERIALLAPFEGQYREIGYQALYSVRMAIAETDNLHLELLAIDDGGTVQSASDRIEAINHDPLISAVLVLGPSATDTSNLTQFDERLRVVPIGDWSDDFQEALEATNPVTCGDICQLPVYIALAENPTNVTISTTAPRVDTDFAERYADFDTFTPSPLPIARLTYEVTLKVLNTPDQVSPATTIYQYTYTEDGVLIPISP
jgi:hypothetical protein